MSEITPSQRKGYAENLISDFRLDTDAEYFSNLENRIEFIESLSATDILDILRHINARMRDLIPREGQNSHDAGGYLPMLGTPPATEKPLAFKAGFETIQQYLTSSTDTNEEKLKGAGMAMEALIIWVHPFNDGNGRTSRFMAKFIEDGTTDIDRLVAETADGNNRLRVYDPWLRADQYNIYYGQDIILDDREREDLERTKMPITDGIALSIKNLLEDKTMQEAVESKTTLLRENLARFMMKKAA